MRGRRSSLVCPCEWFTVPFATLLVVHAPNHPERRTNVPTSRAARVRPSKARALPDSSIAANSYLRLWPPAVSASPVPQEEEKRFVQWGEENTVVHRGGGILPRSQERLTQGREKRHFLPSAVGGHGKLGSRGAPTVTPGQAFQRVPRASQKLIVGENTTFVNYFTG